MWVHHLHQRRRAALQALSASLLKLRSRSLSNLEYSWRRSTPHASKDAALVLCTMLSLSTKRSLSAYAPLISEALSAAVTTAWPATSNIPELRGTLNSSASLCGMRSGARTRALIKGVFSASDILWEDALLTQDRARALARETLSMRSFASTQTGTTCGGRSSSSQP